MRKYCNRFVQYKIMYLNIKSEIWLIIIKENAAHYYARP